MANGQRSLPLYFVTVLHAQVLQPPLAGARTGYSAAGAAREQLDGRWDAPHGYRPFDRPLKGRPRPTSLSSWRHTLTSNFRTPNMRLGRICNPTVTSRTILTCRNWFPFPVWLRTTLCGIRGIDTHTHMYTPHTVLVTTVIYSDSLRLTH